MSQVKSVFGPVDTALRNHLNSKVGDIYESVILPLMAGGSSSEDKIIRAADKTVRAIQDSFSKRWLPLDGKGAVDVPENKNNLLTKRSWMSRASQKLYGERNDRFNEAVEANKKAVAHNAQLADQLAEGKIKAAAYKEQKIALVDADAIKTEIPAGITEGFATKEECVKALQAEGLL